MSITLLQSDASTLTVSVSEAMRYMGVTGDAPEIKEIAAELLPEGSASEIRTALL